MDSDRSEGLYAGIQTGRMSPGQAVELLTSEPGLDRASAEAEVRGYALAPGRPMSYLVGRELLLELRDEAKRRMGARFNLYDFHKALLSSGTVPPALARMELEESLKG